MATALTAVIFCLIIMVIIIVAGYIFLPHYSKNSGIIKATFKPGNYNTHLQGDDPFVVKSNKAILIRY